MYQYSPSHNAVFFAPGFKAAWEFAAADRINGGLAIVAGTLFFDSFDHKIYALDAATGKQRWSADSGAVLMSTPVISKGVVVVGTGRNGLLDPVHQPGIWGRPEGDDELAFDAASGSPIWRYHTVGEDMPSPVIFGDRVVFGNGDRHAYALALTGGHLLWVTALAGIATMSSMSYDAGRVFTSICNDNPSYVCETDAIDPTSGALVWRATGGGSDCSPVIGSGVVVVNGNHDTADGYQFGGSDSIFAFDQKTGKPLWSYAGPTGPYTSVGSMERQIAGAVHNGVLYQSLSNADLMVALRLKDGHPLWTLRTWAPVKMSPVITDKNVLFGDIAGLFYVVDRQSGVINRVSSFLKPFSTSPPVVVGDTLFIANGPTVYAQPIEDL